MAGNDHIPTAPKDVIGDDGDLRQMRDALRAGKRVVLAPDGHVYVASDADKTAPMTEAQETFIEAKLGRVKRLVGIGPPGADGRLVKMSKSLGNAILLTDDPDTVKKKVMGMYTDPKRLRATDPGNANPEENPLWALHAAFNPDTTWVAEHQELYTKGQIGDVAIKKKLIEVLDAFLAPMRTRRAEYAARPDDVIEILRAGTAKANVVAEETLYLAKQAMKQDFFPRKLGV